MKARRTGGKPVACAPLKNCPVCGGLHKVTFSIVGRLERWCPTCFLAYLRERKGARGGH